jgi:hypothetical protein
MWGIVPMMIDSYEIIAIILLFLAACMLIAILVIVLRASLSLISTSLIVATRNMYALAIESKLFYS